MSHKVRLRIGRKRTVRFLVWQESTAHTFATPHTHRSADRWLRSLVCLVAGALLFTLAQAQTAGRLDTTFVGGVGRTIVATNFFKGDARSVLVQADGKIVLVGRACSGVAMCLARLNADGTLDPTFIGPNGAGNGTFNVSLPSNVDLEVISAALQPDGKILVGGNCGDNPPDLFFPHTGSA